jgi:hypothetical protein
MACSRIGCSCNYNPPAGVCARRFGFSIPHWRVIGGLARSPPEQAQFEAFLPRLLKRSGQLGLAGDARV